MNSLSVEAQSSPFLCNQTGAGHTFGQAPGELSAGATGALMIVGRLRVLSLLWIPVIRRIRKGF